MRCLRPAAVAFASWFLVFAGCGEIQVVAVDSGTATSGETDAIAADVDSDTADTQSTDILTNDVLGNECLTDFDCLDKIQGKTPCISAKCASGFCVKVQKSIGVTCKDSTQPPGDCGQTTCDAAGQCVLSNAKDGTVCGAGLCGKKCASGACVVATDADYEDGDPCTKDFCDQGIQIKHEPLTDLTLQCDDKDACTNGDTCIQGGCKGTPVTCSDGIPCTLDTCNSAKGCAHTTDNGKCDDGNPCSVDGCDLALGCTITSLSVGVTCTDGNECTVADACDAAGSCSGKPSDACKCDVDADCVGKTQNLCIGPLMCQGGGCVAIAANAVYCDASENSTCLQNACEPVSGKCQIKSKNEGAPCDDGNACATGTKCQAGGCMGTGALDCDDKNPCTNDLCLPQSGCVHESNTAACDDGNACTTGDLCAKGACSGGAKPCDDGLACTLDGCDKALGTCTHAADPSTCDDGNPCTTDTCDSGKGCIYASNDSAPCDDGDACTANSCKGGTCAATPVCACKSDAECDDKNPCTADTCADSNCQFKVQDGGTCDPADKCQTAGSGTCVSGVCKSGDSPKSCSNLSDACHSGACDPGTGQCGALPKGDGAPCDADNDPCTVTDACISGVCTAGKQMDCSAQSNACIVGICQSDATGAFCGTQPKAPGTACEDGAYCTLGDTCDGQGTCVSGEPQTCGQLSDACNAGYCDEAGKQCGAQAKDATVSCDDGQFCTAYDHCDGTGNCAGDGVVACPGAPCATGVCDPVLQGCGLQPVDAGSGCSDGDPCTISDVCDAAGTCVGGSAVVCSGSNCNTGYCDPATGGCAFKPLGAASPCDDGQKCTTGDHCDGYGSCAGGTWDALCGCNVDAMCDDGNSCTLDTCDASAGTCKFAVSAGQTCDDGDPCTTSSACSSTGTCSAVALFDCSASADTCHVGQCTPDGVTATCKAIALADGTKCDDGLYCTTGEICVTGKCDKGAALGCGSAPTCFVATCTEQAKGCSNTPSTKGFLCSDNEPCTLGDTCDGTGTCQPGSAMANFSNCDDGDPTTSGDLCLNAQCAGFTQVTGATGPLTRVTYDATGDSWWFAAALYSAPTIAAATKWSINPITVDTKGNWSIGKLAAQQNSGPIRALSSQLAGGAGNFAAYHVPGSNTWVAGSGAAFGKSVLASYPATTEWYDVAARVSGTVGYGLLAGYNATDGAVLGRCQGGPSDTTTAWTCNKGATTGAVAVGAGISVYTALCFPPGSCTPSLTYVGGLQKWNGSVASQLDTISATSATGAWGTVNVGPNLKISSSLLTGGLLAYDTSAYTTTGSSTVWAVGPSGSIAYTAADSALLKGMTLYGTNYQFTDVNTLAGYVLVWGYKTDTTTGNLIPVLLTHADNPNMQSDSASWIEHTLALPSYTASACINSAFSSYGLAKGGSKGTTLALVGNYCGNSTYANPANLRGMVYVRK